MANSQQNSSKTGAADQKNQGQASHKDHKDDHKGSTGTGSSTGGHKDTGSHGQKGVGSGSANAKK